MRRMPWLVAFFTFLLGAGVLLAQNPVSIAQLKTAAVDTDSGVKSSGTMRVVLATDQPILTNAWKIDSTRTWDSSAASADKGFAIFAVRKDSPLSLAVSADVYAPLETDGSGRLYVNGSSVTQPVSQSGTWTVQPGNTANTTPWLVTGSGSAGSAATGVLTVQGIASMTKLLVTPDSVALPANQSVNVAQLAGTATDTNSGLKSAGTLRVVLATDQPALTNKLLVTPDSVALPANQSVNVAQLAGTTTDTNSGNKSAGTLRVVLATDQPQPTNKFLVTPDANSAVNVAQMNGVAVTMGAGATGTGVQRTNPVSASATGAAPPASAEFSGGLASGATGGFLTGMTVCDLSKPVNISTATTTLMVTGVSGRQVRICSFHLVTAAANNVAWIEGTGATCGTGSAGMAGGTTAASGYNFAANGGLAIGSGIGEVLTTATTGDSVCLVTSAATQLSGFIKYTIY